MPSAPERPDLSRLLQVELAYLLGRTPRQIHNLTQKGMPVIVDGKTRYYDAQVCVAWFMDQKLRELGDTKEEKQDPTDRLNLARAKIAEHELSEKEGTIVPVEWARRQLEAIALRFKGGLMALPARLSPKLMSARTVADMQSRLLDGCRELSDDLSRLGDDVSLEDETDMKKGLAA